MQFCELLCVLPRKDHCLGERSVLPCISQISAIFKTLVADKDRALRLVFPRL
jgi:hypothetical protein